MRQLFSGFSVLLLALGSPAGVRAGDRAEVELSARYVLAADGPLRVRFKGGELEVAGVDGEDARMEVTAVCQQPSRRCARKLEDLRLVSREGVGGLELELAGLSKRKLRKMEVEARLAVPRDQPLAVKMFAGELRMRDLESDVEVDLWAGEVEIEAPARAFGSVDLDAGIGEAELDVAEQGGVPGRRPQLVGSEVHWHEGAGQAALAVDVQFGEVSVRLR